MFVHVFAFRWKGGVSAERREAALADIAAFKGVVSGLRDCFIGNNVSANSPDFTTTGVMIFDGKAEFDAYVGHPAHLALLEWLADLIDPIELDFEAVALPDDQ